MLNSKINQSKTSIIFSLTWSQPWKKGDPIWSDTGNWAILHDHSPKLGHEGSWVCVLFFRLPFPVQAEWNNEINQFSPTLTYQFQSMYMTFEVLSKFTLLCLPIVSRLHSSSGGRHGRRGLDLYPRLDQVQRVHYAHLHASWSMEVRCSVYPVSLSWHDIRCTEDQSYILFLFIGHRHKSQAKSKKIWTFMLLFGTCQGGGSILDTVAKDTKDTGGASILSLS